MKIDKTVLDGLGQFAINIVFGIRDFFQNKKGLDNKRWFWKGGWGLFTRKKKTIENNPNPNNTRKRFFPSWFSFSKKKDMVHNNKKNYPNLTLNKYWKPKVSLKEGIEKIFYNHLNKLR
jgi:hypothetical protein